MKNMQRVLGYCMMFALVFFVASCGNDLSRGKANTMIGKAVRPQLLGGGGCSVETKSCSFWDIHVDKGALSRLEGMGFIRMKPDTFSLMGSMNHFDLTDAATPYTIQKIGDGGRRSLEIITATIDSVEVNGISKPSDLFGHKVCGATYTVTYKLTPFGEILEKKKVQMSESGKAMFVLFDKGWQLDSL